MVVKFGRYHIFLYKLIKPEAVSLRTLLWKNYHQKHFDLKPPIFGLNFLNEQDHKNKNFMLLCGFEKFSNFFVRIDILERLFVKIINSDNQKNNEIKMVPEMLNLLGCNKENFKKLLKNMNYKIFEKDNETFFKYLPAKRNKKIFNKKRLKESPFGVLKTLNFLKDMFFKNNLKKNQNENFIKISALLIHAAKIDQNILPKKRELSKKLFKNWCRKK